MLTGLRVVVDVQHIYRDGTHRNDRGSVFKVQGGTVAEADLALHYAQTAVAELRQRGAQVFTNDPAHSILVGPYSRRHRSAMAMLGNLYLACHVNAGGGSYGLVEFMATGTLANSSSRAAAAVAKALGTLPDIREAHTAGLVPPARGTVCIEGFQGGPALIIEPFFGDQAQHWRLTTLAGLEEVGRTLADGVSAWWTDRMVS